MNYALLFFQLLPLLLYIAFHYWKGYRAGIIAAVAASLFLLGWEYFANRRVDEISLSEAVLIIVLGIISLRMNNDKFFKFQPTVLSFIFAGLFAFFEYRHDPLMVRIIPDMEKIFVTGEPPTGEVKIFLDNIHSPATLAAFARLSWILIYVYFGHGLLMAYAALYWSSPKWFVWRFSIYPAIMIAAGVALALG